MSANQQKLKSSTLLVVGVALIRDTSYPLSVLVAQRMVGKSHAGLWEFPGGKVEEGETAEDAAIRECREELGIELSVEDLKPLSFASHPLGTGRHLLMPLFVARRWKGEPIGAEGQAIKFVSAQDLGTCDLTPADIPLIRPVVREMEEIAR